MLLASGRKFSPISARVRVQTLSLTLVALVRRDKFQPVA